MRITLPEYIGSSPMNTVNLVWSIGLAVIGLIGMHIAGKKSHWGWFIGLCAQVLWVIFAIVTFQYGFIISALGYGLMYGKNWWKWRKEMRAKTVPA